jgi:hypothetical protein
LELPLPSAATVMSGVEHSPARAHIAIVENTIVQRTAYVAFRFIVSLLRSHNGDT